MNEYSSGVPILVDEGETSLLAEVRNEMLKRLVFFLLMPAVVLFSSILWLTFDWPSIIKAVTSQPITTPKLKKLKNTIA